MSAGTRPRAGDISQLPLIRQVVIGVVASIILHLLFLSSFVTYRWFVPPKIDFARAQPRLKEIELTVEPPEPEPELFTLQKKKQPFIESLGLNLAAQARENALFQSDENMVAASELKARGDAPLPTQDGRTDLHFNEFITQKSLLGEPSPPFPSSAQPGTAESESESEPARPLYKPQRLSETELAASAANVQPAIMAQPPEEAPEPRMEEASSTLPNVDQPSEDEIVLGTRSEALPVPMERVPERPHPVPVPQPVVKEAPRPEQSARRVPTPASTAALRKPANQREQEKSKVDGELSSDGRPAVDAHATPFGRFKTKVNNALDVRWKQYLHEDADLVAFGVVEASYEITAEGSIESVTVLSNTGNARLADVCVRALQDTKAGRLPPDLEEDDVIEGRLQQSVRFNYHLHR